jgi:hypothetical protein
MIVQESKGSSRTKNGAVLQAIAANTTNSTPKPRVELAFTVARLLPQAHDSRSLTSNCQHALQREIASLTPTAHRCKLSGRGKESMSLPRRLIPSNSIHRADRCDRPGPDPPIVSNNNTVEQSRRQMRRRR